MNDFIELSVELSPLLPWADLISQDLGDIGFDSFVQEENKLKAYIKEELFSQKEVEKILTSYGPVFSYQITTEKIVSKNWNAEWEANFQPVIIAEKICIRASFHEARPNIEYDIILSPKMAFGTGHHATTSLVMQEMLNLNFKSKNILDVGCGTAILSILAEKLGAGQIIAIDNDDWAVVNASENIEINKCLHITVEKATVQFVEEKTFNVILANINRNVIIGDIAIYSKLLINQGHLLLSGFHPEDIPLIENEALKNNLRIIHKTTLNNWVMLHLEKVDA